MKRPALGRSLNQVQEEQQTTSDLPQAARTHDPPSSHEAAEDMTASGKRDKHRQIILAAMHGFKLQALTRAVQQGLDSFAK